MGLNGGKGVARVLAQILVLAALGLRAVQRDGPFLGRRSCPRSSWHRSPGSAVPAGGDCCALARGQRPHLLFGDLRQPGFASPWSRASFSATRLSCGSWSWNSASRAAFSSRRPVSEARATKLMSSMGLPTRVPPEGVVASSVLTGVAATSAATSGTNAAEPAVQGSPARTPLPRGWHAPPVHRATAAQVPWPNARPPTRGRWRHRPARGRQRGIGFWRSSSCLPNGSGGSS